MPSARDAVHDGVLRAVDSAIERAWETDRFALEGGLRAALAEETGLPHGDAVRSVFQRYGPVLAGLVVRYTGPGPGRLPDAAVREEAAAALHETVAALMRDLTEVFPWLAGRADPADDYESPAVHESVHEVPHVVLTKGPAAARPVFVEADGGVGARDRSPGSAARRRAQRAERALDGARRTIDDLDWVSVDEWNETQLARLRIDERMAVLWVEDPGRIVVGRDNPAHPFLAELTGVPGAGVHAGSVQRLPDTGALRRTRAVRITGLPTEVTGAVGAEFAVHRFRTSFAPPTRWDRP
ncbi:hypothetical protein [Streptomyces cadmiisoli]|uniref:Uncharacterized protein n=1 Tax=Streptomyces cadmiisoli TaxID=2184053 RepID=A0A2Z4JDF2_9ACTN|nr:hypothetical protein [Streptomyces cadmiisoli]AWW43149.1 hypothetical protein DN051_41795 [Streptomyces cadmiisoli]